MIDQYVDNIIRSLENECYYAALALTLTLPDICGMTEYPNKDVSERYIKWCNNYIFPDTEERQCDLSGEAIYNLRNTFLHQGNLNILSEKITDNENRIDKFLMIVGKNAPIYEFSMRFSIGEGKPIHRGETIDLSYLCNIICDAALDYYNMHKDAFAFNVDIIRAEEFTHQGKIGDAKPVEDVVKDVFNSKKTKRLIKDYTNSVINNLSEADKAIVEEEIERYKVKARTKKATDKTLKKDMPLKKKIYNYIDKHFKDEAIIESKDALVEAIIESDNMKQVKRKIYKIINRNQAGEVFGKLIPLLKYLKYPFE